MDTLKLNVLELLTLQGKEASQLISGSLALLAAIQLMCSAAAAWQGGVEADLRVQGHHVQLPLGVGIIFFGVFHTVFCCMYFYVGFAIWTGVFVVAQAIITWKVTSKLNLVRLFNILGAGLGMALSAVNAFGLFCWAEGLDDRHTFAFRRHCQLNLKIYENCEKAVEASAVYSDGGGNVRWPPRLFEAELRNVQLVSYASLVITGITQLAISIHSIFRNP